MDIIRLIFLIFCIASPFLLILGLFHPPSERWVERKSYLAYPLGIMVFLGNVTLLRGMFHLLIKDTRLCTSLAFFLFLISLYFLTKGTEAMKKLRAYEFKEELKNLESELNQMDKDKRGYQVDCYEKRFNMLVLMEKGGSDNYGKMSYSMERECHMLRYLRQTSIYQEGLLKREQKSKLKD